MFRIDSDGAVPSQPTPDVAGATSGYFSAGDPGTGVKATRVSDDWLNAVQETLLHPIEKKDLDITTKTAPYDKLTAAIQAMLAEAGAVSGLRMAYSAGTLTIEGEDGNALSTTNFGYVPCKSVIAGKRIALKVTAPITLKDDAFAGTSQLTNLGFGITEASHWAQDVPFFIYVVNKADTDVDATDGHSKFFIARLPNLVTTPSSANDIGDADAIPSNDSQNVILILGSVTQADYTSLPCRLIGALRMQWSTTSDDWTIQTLGNTDGFGEDALSSTFAKEWTFPVAQNGAGSGYVVPNGGTAPVFTSGVFVYYISREGIVQVDASITGDGGTDGSGAQTLEVAMPYTFVSSADRPIGYGRVECSAYDLLAIANGKASASKFEMLVQTLSGAALQNDVKAMINNDFGNGGRTITARLTFRV